MTATKTTCRTFLYLSQEISLSLTHTRHMLLTTIPLTTDKRTKQIENIQQLASYRLRARASVCDCERVLHVLFISTTMCKT